MNSASRGRVLAVLLCLVGALIVLVASGRAWAHAVVVESGFPRLVVNPSGRAIAAEVPGLAILSLAAGLALYATRRWVRALIAVVIVFAGAIIVVESVNAATHTLRATAGPLADAIGRTQVTATSVSGTIWPWIAAFGGALIVGSGAYALARGWAWPGLSSRYERESNRAATTDARGSEAAPRPAGATSMWDALDRGEDPTGEDLPE